MSDDVKLPVEKRQFAVPLDNFRKVQLGEEQAQARGEEIRITGQLKDVTETLKNEIRKVQKRQNVTSELIRQGFEMKEIPCERVVDLPTNTVKVVRSDTGEAVDTYRSGPKRAALAAQQTRRRHVRWQIVGISVSARAS